MTTMTAIAQSIHQTNEKFMDAFRRKDAPGVARCYTATATVLPPRGEPLSGQEAIAEFWKSVMDMGLTDVDLTTSEVVELGETAYEVGRYALSAGEKIADRGKYLIIWRMEGDEWRLHRDIWNTSIAG